MIKDEAMKPKEEVVIDEISINMRRDPEEEYFMLAVLANKMIHTDEHDNPEYVYEINAKKLFAQVKTLKVPFHRWYKWLETRFMQL